MKRLLKPLAIIGIMAALWFILDLKQAIHIYSEKMNSPDGSICHKVGCFERTTDIVTVEQAAKSARTFTSDLSFCSKHATVVEAYQKDKSMGNIPKSSTSLLYFIIRIIGSFTWLLAILYLIVQLIINIFQRYQNQGREWFTSMIVITLYVCLYPWVGSFLLYVF